MLHIVLNVMRIIGIVVAVVLALFLILVGAILFSQIRYKAKGDFPGKLEQATVHAEISWLFHLVSGCIRFEDEQFHWKMRVGWFHFDDDGEEKRKEKEKERTTEINRPPLLEVKEPQKEVQEEPSEKVAGEKEKAKKKIEMQKHQGFFDKIKCTFQHICVKIRNISKMKEQIVDFLKQEVHKNAWEKVKKEKRWLFRFLKLKRFELNVHYGFDDPCTTGQVLAILSMIYPFVGDNMNVQPDFEKKVFEGNFYLKGRGRLIFPVIYGIKLILDANVRETFSDIRNFKFE